MGRGSNRGEREREEREKGGKRKQNSAALRHASVAREDMHLMMVVAMVVWVVLIEIRCVRGTHMLVYVCIVYV